MSEHIRTYGIRMDLKKGKAALRLTPLHPLFGVEVHAVDLRALRVTSGYAEIRATFEKHSLLLFRRQTLDDEAHLALGALFGPIEDRSMGGDGSRPRMANVSNRLESGAISAPDSAHTLDLETNWIQGVSRPQASPVRSDRVRDASAQMPYANLCSRR